MTNHGTHFHIFHYLILIFILGLGVLSFFFSAANPDKQFSISIITSVAYFIWGMVHHRLEDDLHPKIVIEYLLISIVAVLLLKGAIYR